MEVESLIPFLLGIFILIVSMLAKNIYSLVIGLCFIGLSFIQIPYVIGIFYIIIGTSVLLYTLRTRNAIDKKLAIIDSLTGVYSRYFFEEYIKKELGKAKRYNKKFSVLFIDLNDFKLINDRFGHSAGDKVLNLIATKLSNTLRDCDIIARWGGDEFAVFLTETNCNELLEVIDRLYSEVNVSYGDVKVTLSIGFACYPEHGQSIEELIHEADKSMYRAKNMYKMLNK